MPRFMRLMAAFVISCTAVAPVVASPEGVWELDSRDTRFGINLCGDGMQLCGELVWLSDVDYNEQYKPYLNRPIGEALQPSGQGKWKGSMNLLGHQVNGTITQYSDDHMSLSACAFLVVCKTYQMYRHTP